MPCPACDGFGRIEHEDGVSSPLTCPSCEGVGMVDIVDEL
jgi:DnaJ-class molecular chaperone